MAVCLCPVSYKLLQTLDGYSLIKLPAPAYIFAFCRTYPGNNSGFGALQLAFHLGANPIYLLGFDMKYKRAKLPKTWVKLPRAYKHPITHFHQGYPEKRKYVIGERGARVFSLFADCLKKYNERERHPRAVFNCSVDSDILCFDCKPIDEVL